MRYNNLRLVQIVFSFLFLLPGSSTFAEGKLRSIFIQLGDSDYEKREQASKDLFAEGTSALDQMIEEYKTSDEPEVKARIYSVAYKLFYSEIAGFFGVGLKIFGDGYIQISQLLPNSPAEKAEIQPSEYSFSQRKWISTVILSIDGQSFKEKPTVKDVRKAMILGCMNKDRKVKIEVVRVEGELNPLNEKPEIKEVTLGKLPPEMLAQVLKAEPTGYPETDAENAILYPETFRDWWAKKTGIALEN